MAACGLVRWRRAIDDPQQLVRRTIKAEEQTQGIRPFLEVQQAVRRLLQELVHYSLGADKGKTDVLQH
jgi:hypothetical protein